LDAINEIIHRLDRLESAVQVLVRQRVVKDWYSTAEVAEMLGKSEYTVREYCRLGRIRARKKPCGRGKGGEWLISHQELEQLRNFGPGPESPRQ
jgi:DNA-directed RNA polymerase specialized sigma24 family protein